MAQPPQQPHIDKLLAAEEDGKIYVSFEYFPPRTEKGEDNLRNHLLNFAAQKPVFTDFTWGAGGTTSQKTPEWVKYCMSIGLTANMHLTCTNMEEGKVHEALEFCKANGIRNIVALRGDPPAGETWKASAEGFGSALDLVKYIRKNYGDMFSIAVAGYPEGHPDRIGESGTITTEEYKKEMEYLKLKVDAGGDFIITQLFYDVQKFIQFVKDCRDIGIKVPILPGMLPMVSYAGLQRMGQLCKTYVPPEVRAKCEELKENEQGFKDYGIALCTQMCQDILKAGVSKHFHFYTLNLEYSTFEVMKNLGLYIPPAPTAQSEEKKE